MRIALLSGEYPPLQGGVGDYTRELARALAAKGHAPYVLTRFVNGSALVEQTEGIAVHRLVSRWDWQTRRRVEAFLRVHRPDVLNIQYQAAAYHMHPAINLLPKALQRRVPVVVTFHDLRTPYLFPKAGFLRWKSIVFMAKSAAACIVTNIEDYETLQAEGIERLHLVPIGSNIAPAALEHFDRAAWRRAHGLPESAAVIGYFGFLNESKGGESLIHALAELRKRGVEAHVLHIGGQVGDSDPTNAAYAARLERLADALGVSAFIHRTGFLEPRAVSEAFAACDCVALPYRDGASFRRGTLMAALAHGCATVTTTPRVPLPELQHGENALLVPPDSPIRLADAILQVLQQPSLRSVLQQGARQLSARFQWDHIAEATLRVYQQLLPNADALPASAP
ncbi:MAG: glycosyltransferase family 4 protein [Thermoflexales bacterium]|nr:glycosyltransferase family 4 protein [Thermoflexales bacterium]